MDGEYKYRITTLAYEDIDSACLNLANPIAAANLYEKIETAIQKCRDLPFSYPDCRYYFIADTNYRHASVGNYVLFFRVRETEHTIEFLRFLFSSMDFSEIQIEE